MLTRKLLFFMTVLLFASCATKKKVTVPKEPTTNVNTTDNANYLINNLDYRTFNGRAKTKIEFGDQKHDATLNIRIKKDQAIWISVTATVFNYEAARILITPDSVRILNKLQSEYISKPFSYIHKYTGAGISFAMLQDLLMANVSNSLIRTQQMTAASSSDDVQLVGVKENLSFQYSLNSEYRPRVFKLNVIGSSESLQAFYGSFNRATGYNFPQNQNLKLNAKSIVVNAILDYNKLEFNQEVEIPFNVPAKYTVVN